MTSTQPRAREPRPTVVDFGGHRLVLRPATSDTEQSVHLNQQGVSDVEALTVINRFLSVLSWCCDQPMQNLYGWSGNPVPVAVPKQRPTLGSTFTFPFSRNIEANETAQLALALFREGKTAISIPFEFLSYFKILNILWKDKFEKVNGQRLNPIVEGIRATLTHLKDEKAAQRIAMLQEGTFRSISMNQGAAQSLMPTSIRLSIQMT